MTLSNQTSRCFCTCIRMHSLCTQSLQPLQYMLLLPTPVQQTVHGYSPELCNRFRPVPQIMTFAFPPFTLNPFFSMASFHIKSLMTHSSRESAMMTRSSAYRSSQGTPARNSCDKAYSTMMKSKGLSTDPALSHPFFGNGAGAHGIGKISSILTKIGKFLIVLMYDVSIARLIPIIKLTK